jgi:hypothetical protein
MTHIGWRADDTTLVVETLYPSPHDGRAVRSEVVRSVVKPAR